MKVLPIKTKFERVLEDIKNDPDMDWFAGPLESYEDLDLYFPDMPDKLGYIRDKGWLPILVRVIAKHRKKIYAPEGDGWAELMEFMKRDDITVNDVVDSESSKKISDLIFNSISIDYDYDPRDGSDFMKKLRQRFRATSDLGLTMELYGLTERNFLNRSGFNREDYNEYQKSLLIEEVVSKDTGFMVRDGKIYTKTKELVDIESFMDLVGSKNIKDKIRKGETEQFFNDSWDVSEATGKPIFDSARLVAEKGMPAIQKVIEYKKHIPPGEEQYFTSIVAEGGNINVREVHGKTRAMPRLHWSEKEINELIKIKYRKGMEDATETELAETFIKETGSIRKITSVLPWISRNKGKLKQQKKLK